MVVPRKLRVNKPKNFQYDLRPDGSLLCGPGCFSTLNVLKIRFLDLKSAQHYVKTAPRSKNQVPYACEYCKGFHLTRLPK